MERGAYDAVVVGAETNGLAAAVELRQIAENGGRWPAPSAAEVAHERDLSAAQARWLAERFVGHPGRTVSEPAVLNRSLEEQQATYIMCTRGDTRPPRMSRRCVGSRTGPSARWRPATGRWCRPSTSSSLCSPTLRRTTADRLAHSTKPR